MKLPPLHRIGPGGMNFLPTGIYSSWKRWDYKRWKKEPTFPEGLISALHCASVLYTNAFPHFSSNDSTYRWGTWLTGRLRTSVRTSYNAETSASKLWCPNLLHFSILTKSRSSGSELLRKIQIQIQTWPLWSAFSYIMSQAHVSEGAWNQRNGLAAEKKFLQLLKPLTCISEASQSIFMALDNTS